MHAIEAIQQGRHLGHREHHRQARRPLRRLDAVQPGQLDFQHLAVEEQQRGLGLVLGRCRHVAHDREVGEKGLDLDRPHLARVALAKMSDKSFNPVQICLLGTQAVVQEAYPAPHLLKQPRRRTRIHR
jgi:hypothetical protein